MTAVRIAVASDGSELATSAVRRTALLLSSDTRYTVLTVVNPPSVAAGLDGSCALARGLRSRSARDR